VAQEIEDVGRSERNAAQGLIRQILIHVIKAVSVSNIDLTMHARDLPASGREHAQALTSNRLWAI
jgi:hypothetical protein